MKITYILPVYWPAIGGCEIHTHELVTRISEKHEVNVLTLLNNQQDKLSSSLWFSSILRAARVAQSYHDNKAKVTRMSLNVWQKVITFPLARVQSPKVPNFVRSAAMEILSGEFEKILAKFVLDSDLIHCVHGGVSYLGYASLKLAHKKSIPFIYTPLLHPRLSDNGSAELNIIPRGWNDAVWLNICKRADALLTMTKFEKKIFIDHGISKEKVFHVGVGPVVANNGDVDIKEFLKKYKINENAKIILFLGRNHESKGIYSLLNAAKIVWEAYPDTCFLFVGPQEGISQQIFNKFMDDRIIKTGAVTLTEKTAALKICDIFCMPSLEESLGGVFLEAWSFGKPVIGGDIPPVRDLIEDEKGGFLVKSDPMEIAQKIMTLLVDEGLRNKMGIWGKEKVQNNFTWDIIMKKIEDVYTRCLGGEG